MYANRCQIVLGDAGLELTREPVASNVTEVFVWEKIAGVIPVFVENAPHYRFPNITEIVIVMDTGNRLIVELQEVTNQPTWNSGSKAALDQAMEDINSFLSLYDIDTLAYFSELLTQPTPAYKKVVNTTVVSLKNTGNFSKIDRLTLYCSQQRENAVISLVNPTSLPSEEVGDVSWLPFKGFTGGDNTKRIDSNFNPVNDGVNYTRNSATLFLWADVLVDENSVDGGIQIGTNGSGAFVFSNFSNTLYASINDSDAGGIIQFAISGTGLIAVVRKTNTLVQVWQNGIKVYEGNTPSTALQNFNFWWLCLNREDTPQYPSTRELSFVGNASGDLDQLAFYNTMNSHMTSLASLPVPPIPPDPGISDVVAKIHFPSLLDVSGNGYDSVLGDSLPVGITAPSQVSGDTIFNGLQSIKLHAALPITKLSNHTQFFTIYCDSPEQTQCLLNMGTVYTNGTRLFVETVSSLKKAMIGAVYLDEAAADEPFWGQSLPKLQVGYNIIGLSFSQTDVVIFVNGIVSKVTTNNSYPATGLSGWFGAWPGSPSDNYTLPAYYTVEQDDHIWIYDYAATRQQMQIKGNAMMREKDVSLVVFEGDSITLGYGITTNANNWPSVVTQYLLDNTSKKWSSLNVAVGGRALVTMAASCNQNNYNISGNGVASCNINVIAPAEGATALNVYNLLAGINDIAAGSTLLALQNALTTIIDFRNSQGFNCFVYSVTPAQELTAPEEAIRLAYNAWLSAQASTIGFTFIDICADPNFSSQSSADDTSYFSDGIHLTDLACTSIIGPMAGAEIVSNI